MASREARYEAGIVDAVNSADLQQFAPNQSASRSVGTACIQGPGLADSQTSTIDDPVAAITDVVRWVTKHLRGDPFERRAKLIIRRLESVRAELEQLKSKAQQEN